MSSFSSWALSRSWPNGFSTISRAQPRPAARRAERGDDRGDCLRRDGEVVDAVAPGPLVAVELVEARKQLLLAAVLAEVGRHVGHVLGQPVPDVLPELVARVLGDRLAHTLAEVVGLHRRAGDADDPVVLGQEAAEGQRVERRHQLPLGQVAGGAEDRERKRLRRPAHAQACGQGVLGDGGLGHSAVFASSGGRAASTAWPPNWLRSAAFTFAAKDSSWREAKRA